MIVSVVVRVWSVVVRGWLCECASVVVRVWLCECGCACGCASVGCASVVVRVCSERGV